MATAKRKPSALKAQKAKEKAYNKKLSESKKIHASQSRMKCKQDVQAVREFARKNGYSVKVSPRCSKKDY